MTIDLARLAALADMAMKPHAASYGLVCKAEPCPRCDGHNGLEAALDPATVKALVRVAAAAVALTSIDASYDDIDLLVVAEAELNAAVRALREGLR